MFLRRLNIILFLFVTTCHSNRLNVTCGTNTNNISIKQFKIVHGYEANPYNWPWMVSLRYNHTHHCGAFLIHKRYVLTAAHCLYRKNISLLEVAVGMHNIKMDLSEQNVFKISQIYLHEQFRYTSFYRGYDIGLILLESEVTLSDRVALVCLPSSDQDVYFIEEKDAYTVGWGRIDKNGVYNFSSNLQETILSINTDIIACRQVNVDLRLTYCALSNLNSTTCNGDSGGPLFIKMKNLWYAFGVTSFGYQTITNLCLTQFPNYFTKIPLFLDWIELKISLLELN